MRSWSLTVTGVATGRRPACALRVMSARRCTGPADAVLSQAASRPPRYRCCGWSQQVVRLHLLCDCRQGRLWAVSVHAPSRSRHRPRVRRPGRAQVRRWGDLEVCTAAPAMRPACRVVSRRRRSWHPVVDAHRSLGNLMPTCSPLTSTIRLNGGQSCRTAHDGMSRARRRAA